MYIYVCRVSEHKQDRYKWLYRASMLVITDCPATLSYSKYVDTTKKKAENSDISIKAV